MAIENCKTPHSLFEKIDEIYESLFNIGKHAIFTCLPSHIGIHGNTIVDQ